MEEWRRSGKTAEEFAVGQPFSGGTLAWRASQLKREADSRRKPTAASKRRRVDSRFAFAEVVRRPRPTHGAALTVELGNARISVGAGFDAALLRDVVRALREGQS